MVRQQLELRRAAADQTASIAQQRIDVANVAEKLVDAAVVAERDHLEQQAIANTARDSASEAAAKEKAATDELRRCDLLERALDLRLAERQVVDARTAVDKHAGLQARLAATLEERAAFEGQRAAMTVPTPSALTPMRRLANELAAARGALDVGFVVTVSPSEHLDLQIRRDGTSRIDLNRATAGNRSRSRGSTRYSRHCDSSHPRGSARRSRKGSGIRRALEAVGRAASSCSRSERS